MKIFDMKSSETEGLIKVVVFWFMIRMLIFN